MASQDRCRIPWASYHFDTLHNSSAQSSPNLSILKLGNFPAVQPTKEIQSTVRSSLMNPEASNKGPLEETLRHVAAHIEIDLRRVATSINDEVVTEVRRNGSQALRTAATQLARLAERLEAANRNTPPPQK